MDQDTPLYRRPTQEELERARAMPLAEKFLAGAILFEKECEEFRARCRLEHPEWTEIQVEAELSRIYAEKSRAKGETLLFMERACRISPI